MTIVWPVIVSVRHIVTPMSAQSSMSAGFFTCGVAAGRSIFSGRRLVVGRVLARCYAVDECLGRQSRAAERQPIPWQAG